MATSDRAGAVTRLGMPFRALWVATVVGAVAMVAMIASLLSMLGTDQDLTLIFCILALDVVAFSTMGLLIERRRPGNRIAWVLGAAGALIVVAFSGFAIGALRYALFGSDDTLGGLAAAIGGATLGPALFVTVPLPAVLFPDGRLPGPRWRLPLVVAVTLIVVPSVVGLVQPGPVNTELPDNPFGIDVPVVTALSGLATLLPVGIFVGAVLAIAAVATRFRRSRGVEREQMKWLLAAVTVIAVCLPASFMDAFLDSSGGFTILDALAMTSLALLPASIGIAVLRYRLYEIDRIVSRTLGWAIVTGLLVAVFAFGVVALQAVLSGFTRDQTLAVAASTLVAFALFQPLRRRVQRAVDRRFDRARYDAERTATAFADRLRDETDIEAVAGDLSTTTRAALAPRDLGIWLRDGGR